MLQKEFSSQTDAELAQLVCAGDTDAFAELAARYLSFIRWRAESFRTVSLETEDLCQEGLYGLLCAAHSYRGGASFRTYAGVCIRNRILSACRTASGGKNMPLNNSISLNQEPDLALDYLSCDFANPETLLIDRENLQIVKNRIRKELSGLEREVLSLYLQGKSYDEIARSLCVTKKAADNAIPRIRKKLKKPC